MTFRAFFAASLLVALPVLASAGCDGCKKPPPAQVDAAPEPPPGPPDVVVLEPLDSGVEDAAADADADAKHGQNVGPNPNEAKVRQCCAQMRSRVAQMPNPASPEMIQLKAWIAQCDALAAQVHQNPKAPELSLLNSFPGCH